jgi:AAA domain
MKKKYTAKSGRELYDVKVPPMLIDPFLPAGCLGGLSGGPGVGKSWFALEACRAVATGTPFLGKFDVQTSKPVLYIGSDSSEFDYGRCWRRLTQKQYEALGGARLEPDPTFEGDPDEAPCVDLNPLDDRVHFIIGSDFMLDSDVKVEAMIEAVDYEWGPYFEATPECIGSNIDGEPEMTAGGWSRRHGSGLIIMDTFGSLTDQDLLDNSAMIGVYKGLRRFVEKTKATVLLLNHNPHGRESWLGAISQVGKLDFWLHVKRVEKHNDARLQVVFAKVRGIKPKSPVIYRMNVSDPETASLVAETAAPPAPSQPESTGTDDLRRLVVDEVVKQPRTVADLVAVMLSIPDMASSEAAAKHRLKDLLPEMVREGAIVVVKEAKGNKAAIYGPSTNGVRAA